MPNFVSNAEFCSASGAWHGEKPINGNENTAKLTFNQNYTLTCEGSGGVMNKSVSITVGSKTYNYIWSAGNWSSCNSKCNVKGIQIRQVTCKRDDGQSASEDKCASSKPSVSQKCKSPCFACGATTVSINAGGKSCPVNIKSYPINKSFKINCRYHSWDNSDNSATATCNSNGNWILSDETSWVIMEIPIVVAQYGQIMTAR